LTEEEKESFLIEELWITEKFKVSVNDFDYQMVIHLCCLGMASS